MRSARILSHMNHVSVSLTDGNGPTQGQRKTLTRVGIEIEIQLPPWSEFFSVQFAVFCFHITLEANASISVSRRKKTNF